MRKIRLALLLPIVFAETATLAAAAPSSTSHPPETGVSPGRRPAVVVQEAPRRLTPEDLFRVESVRAIAWSPDGGHAAVEIVRGSDDLDVDELRTDIHLLRVRTGELERLTDGAADGHGNWNPVWSPDGQTLAFLRAAPDGSVRPAIWRTGDRTPRVLGDVDVRVGIGGSSIAWSDAGRLIAFAWPEGAQKSGSLFFKIVRARYAPELWAARIAGVEASVTVLESGPDATVEPPIAPVDVVVHDLSTGRSRVAYRDYINTPRLSPRADLIAYFRPQPGIPREPVARFLEHEELYSSVNWGSELVVADLERGETVSAPLDLLDPAYESVSWSADGTRLAAIGYPRSTDARSGEGAGAEPGSSRPGLVVFDERGLGFAALAGLGSVSGVSWNGDRLLVRARAGGGGGPGGQGEPGRADWWEVAGERPVNLTADLESSPFALHAVGDGAVLAESGGRVWSLEAGSAPRALGDGLDPVSGLRSLGSYGTFYARVGGAPAFLSFDGEGLHAAPITTAERARGLRALSPTGDAAILLEDDEGGTDLVLLGAGPGADEATIWRGNTWVEGVARGRPIHLEYTSEAGAPLHGWLLIPAGHDGEPLAMVVDVYPGRSYGPSEPSDFELTRGHFLHAQLFASLGYAVLLPSMPEPDDLLSGDPFDEVTDGVLPALDAAIGTGLIAPDRIAVIGQSNGGFGTLALIAQTDRFRAAIASASFSNLVSLYGTFYGQYRHGEGGSPQRAQVLRMMQLERGYGRMGGTPWERRERYLHNSPVLHAPEIETPLMLVHGDLDFIPIQQAEEMFTALYRLDRPVRFVRYHGEWHTVSGKANVLDLWERMADWLDRHIGG